MITPIQLLTKMLPKTLMLLETRPKTSKEGPEKEDGNCLQAQALARATDNADLHLSRSQQGVRIWHSGQGSLLGSVLTVAEVIVIGDMLAVVG
jgi:hypothetical protein